METSTELTESYKPVCGCCDVGEHIDALTTCNGVLVDDFTAALGGSHVKSIEGRKKPGPARRPETEK